MSFYGDKTKAASLAGVLEADITEAMEEIVNANIDADIYPSGFGATLTATDEYYDIKKIGQSE